MSQDPTKFDPKETTEAKLCAYVDGELDANGRAEIEKYLENNPQHRKLLKELTQTRELMRALPRAAAPADIGELLHGQLERSLLLNDLDTEPEAENMRISHAAQFRAVAAVILLAVGLGAIVYFVLPSSNQRTAVVIGGIPPADHEASTTAPHNLIVPEYDDTSRSIAATPRATSSPAPTPAAPSLAQADPFSGQDRAMAKTAGKAEGEVNRSDAKNLEIIGGSGGGLGTFAAKQKSAYDSAAKAIDPFRSRVQQTLLNANATQGQPASNFTCVVVSTNDPAATKERVNTFLVSNKIQWQPIEEPMPAPIQFSQSQIALSSRLNQTTVQLRRAEDINGLFKGGSNVGVVSNGEPQTPGTQALVGALPSSAPNDVQYYNMKVAGSAGAPAATAPSAPIEAAAPQPARQSTTDEAKQMAQKLQQEQPAQQQRIETLDLNNLAQQPADASEQYIVARNMTTAQTVELKDLLSRQGGPHTVEVFDSSTIDEPLTKLRDLDKVRERQQSAATEPSDDTLVANAPPLDPAKRDLKKDSASAATTAESAPLAFSRSQPATDSAKFVAKEPVAAKTQSVVENRLKLEPSTQPTQDVVIVFRHDLVEGQFQQSPAPTSAPLAAPVPAAPAAPPPSPAAGPATDPSSTAPATQTAP